MVSTATPGLHRMEKIRTIVADDSEFALRMMTRFLRALGNVEVIETASDGAKALQLAKRLCPRLAILDFEMFPMNGLDACREIVASCPGTDVVLVSVHAGEELQRACVGAGALAFISKSRLSLDLPAILDEIS